jgi:hypothetical protein
MPALTNAVFAAAGKRIRTGMFRQAAMSVDSWAMQA